MSDPASLERRFNKLTAWLVIFVGLGVAVEAGVVWARAPENLIGFGVLLAAIGVFGTLALPAGFVLGAGLLSPATVPDKVRVSGVLVGAAGIWVAWLTVAGSGRPGMVPYGASLAVLSVVVTVAALRAPRPGAWRPAFAPLIAGAALAAFYFGFPGLRTSGSRSDYAEVRQAAEAVAAWQNAHRADSGRYAERLDSAQTASLAGRGISVRLRTSADAYSALVFHDRLVESCAVFAGPGPWPEDTPPGVPDCAPRIGDHALSVLGQAWLIALLGCTAVGFLARRVPSGGAA